MITSLMRTLVALLFSAALLPLLARLAVALLGPVFRSLALPPADLKALVGFIAGVNPMLPELAGYEAAEVREIGDTVRALLEGVAAGFQVAITPVQLRALLAAIADRLPAGA